MAHNNAVAYAKYKGWSSVCVMEKARHVTWSIALKSIPFPQTPSDWQDISYIFTKPRFLCRFSISKCIMLALYCLLHEGHSVKYQDHRQGRNGEPSVLSFRLNVMGKILLKCSECFCIFLDFQLLKLTSLHAFLAHTSFVGTHFQHQPAPLPVFSNAVNGAGWCWDTVIKVVVPKWCHLNVYTNLA